MQKLKPITRVAVALSALMMISAYFVPLWQIVMWAPQYPEGLGMKIWLDNITGDVKIISALNHYIGMRHIEVSMFPEFQYMIYIVGLLIAAGLLAALINRRIALIVYAVLVIGSGVAALVDFYLWGYDYGHNLDPTAAIVVPGMAYQPPLIGTKQLLNFTAFSGPDVGGWIFLVCGLLAVGGLGYELYLSRKRSMNTARTLVCIVILISLYACNVGPEPLRYGEDACHTCKMTLMDKKFGAEVVSAKGKIFKFDDMNCMVNFLNSGTLAERDIAHRLVVDYATPEKLIAADNAFYLKSSEIRSPMASQVAAFERKADMERHLNTWRGIYLTWGELVTQFK